MLVGCVLLLAGMVGGCKISELMCRNGKCVPSDLYCNGVNDCGDNSDEPKYCTVCNRTYYGDSEWTYTMNLKRPRQDRLPFLCHITFTANGNEYGDIVQVVLDKFAIGHLDPDQGCPDGYMSVTELGRPLSEGGWCGEATGPTVYFSESTTLTISIRLLHPSPFKFSIRYKFLRGPEAVSRLGSAQAPVDRGVHVPGSHCSVTFDECYRTRCQVQSPNYPGLYPRNVTCEYTIKQKTVPTCKHAMIAVRDNVLRLKRSVAGLNKTVVYTRRDCSPTEDRLLFFDTTALDSNPLAEYCGGGLLPRVISRGSQLTLHFRSSPYATPHAGPQHGFSLGIDVVFADSDSLDFARGNKAPNDTQRAVKRKLFLSMKRKKPLINSGLMNWRICEFYVNGTKKPQGVVISPRHSLPANTTCSYQFVGAPYHRVWTYFASYTLPQTGGNCSSELRLREPGGNILVSTCGAPRLCDHSALRNVTRETRPCSIHESYLTRLNKLHLEYRTEEGTALVPGSFKFYFEFVDTRLGGEAVRGGGSCARIFRRAKSGVIRSPRNVFMFGRGGAHNLSCHYRLECAPGERVELIVKRASFGHNGCKTVIDPNSRQPICAANPGQRSVQLTVYDLPWPDVRLEKGCHCDNTVVSKKADGVVSFTSSGRLLELTFLVSAFNLTEDFNDIYFEGTYRFVKFDDCPRRQRVSGSGGEIRLTARPTDRDDLHCLRLPWLVEAGHNKSLFLLTWGRFMTPADTADACHTTNRVLIYTGSPFRLLRVVCPATEKEKEFAVHVFSEDWTLGWSAGPPSFLVRLVGSELGTAHLSWLEISRSRGFSAGLVGNNSWECRHRCPELDACISPGLYCDGQINCPSGFDENNPDCGVAKKLIWMLSTPRVAALAGTGFLLLLFCIVCLGSFARRSGRHRAGPSSGKS